MDLGLGYCNSVEGVKQVFSSRQATQFLACYIQRIRADLSIQQPMNTGGRPPFRLIREDVLLEAWEPQGAGHTVHPRENFKFAHEFT